MPSGLIEVLLQSGAVRPAWSHCDLGLQHSNQRVLIGARFTEILHDLLLRTVHLIQSIALPVNTFESRSTCVCDGCELNHAHLGFKRPSTGSDDARWAG